MFRYVVESNNSSQIHRNVEILDNSAHINGKAYVFEYMPENGMWYVRHGNKVFPFVVQCEPTGHIVITIHGYPYELICLPERLYAYCSSIRSTDKTNHTIIHIRAPMPGLVKTIHIDPGTTVHRGESIIILEAMKMENLIRAPIHGIVQAVHVISGSAVEKGQVLCSIETNGR